MKYYQKLCIKTEKVTDRRTRSKTLNEVKPDRNINKNWQSFLAISPVQQEVLPLHKLQYHAYEQNNLSRLKEDNPSQRNFQNHFSDSSLSHMEQEC